MNILVSGNLGGSRPEMNFVKETRIFRSHIWQKLVSGQKSRKNLLYKNVQNMAQQFK